MQSTRAVTINAPAAAVWPWLVQLGAGRGGMYSYDLLENAAGLGIHSADRILPEHQQLDVGDVVPLASGKGPDVGIPVRRVEAGSVLGLGGTMDPRTGQIRPSGGAPAGPRVELGWTFVLQPVNGHSTRLLSRTRYDYSPLPVGLILRPVLEPLQFVMERRMLLGIKSRAEGPVAGAGWPARGLHDLVPYAGSRRGNSLKVQGRCAAARRVPGGKR